ncbi:MAG: hypothetical protein ACRD2Y_02230 [Terriglobales bacterium]
MKQAILWFIFVPLVDGSALLAQAGTSSNDSTGAVLSVEQLGALHRSLPRLPGRIVAARPFEKTPGLLVLLVHSHRFGSQVFVFAFTPDQKPELRWKSGKLGEAFAQALPAALKTVMVGDKEVLIAEGCGEKGCAEAAGSLVYVPGKQASFHITSVKGTLDASPALLLPENQPYLDLLQQKLAARTTSAEASK